MKLECSKENTFSIAMTNKFTGYSKDIQLARKMNFALCGQF